MYVNANDLRDTIPSRPVNAADAFARRQNQLATDNWKCNNNDDCKEKTAVAAALTDESTNFCNSVNLKFNVI